MMQRCNKLPKLEMGENLPQWSNLPQEVLSKIASFLELEGPSDKIRLQLVCKKWYASCLPSCKHVLYSNLPLKIPIIPPVFVQDKGPIFIVGTCVYLVQPLEQPLTQPWLVSVEEVNLGKVRIHAPLTKKPIEDVPLNFTKGVDFSRFRVSLVHESLKICFDDGCEDVVRVSEKGRRFGLAAGNRVILVTDEENLSDDCCVAIVLLICEGGTLTSFNPTTGSWRLLHTTRVSRFDDIVCFKGFVYTIDRKGRLYPIDVEDDNVARMGDVTSNAISGGRAGDTRKRLVVLDEELHMIQRSSRKFNVYKFNGEGKWVEVKTLGKNILLVTLDDVFCVDASEFPRCRGNCILFSKQCFPDYVGCSLEIHVFHRANTYLEVGAYYLGEDSSLPISCYPEFHDMLWPFPSWISSVLLCSASSSRETSSRVTALKSSREAPDMTVASSVQTSRKDIAKRDSESEIPYQSNDDSVQAICYIPQIHESGSPTQTLHIMGNEVPEKPIPEIIDVDSDPDDAFQNTNAENVDRFEGVNVNSCFIPILHKIQNKLGNIIPGNVDEVQSDSIFLNCCLETIAQAVKILLSESARSLSDSDAKFLGACLSDLQFMRCNVEVVNWLVPFVKSALDHHHKNKEQICKLRELQTVRLKMLDLLHQLEEEEKKIADDLSVAPFLDIKNELC